MSQTSFEKSLDSDWQFILTDILPPQGNWTEEEYLVLTEHRRRLVEFTDGFLKILPIPTEQHQLLLKFLFLVFFNHFERAGGIVMFAPLRLQIRPGKYREPDLMLLQTIQDPRRENRFWTGADLVLEVVSEDKPDRDLIEKKEAYAEAVIPEYWIVNPLNASVTVLRLQSGSYLEFGVYHRGENALSALHPGFSFSVDSLFDAGKVP